MKIHDVEQGSAAWHAIKCGIPSASNFDKIITFGGKPSTQRMDYLYQCAGEKIANLHEESYQSADMLRGIIMEDEARKLYEITYDLQVVKVGFCENDSPIFGCSPDGFIGEDGMLQIKCPKIKTHVKYLLSNRVPIEYFPQVQGELLVTGRKWLDFMSYYPGLRPLIVRVLPDKNFQEALYCELEQFCRDLDGIVERIR